MAQQESFKDSKSKQKKKRKDPRIEKEYFEEIEITDPVTGEKKIQKVKITRYKPSGMPKPLGNKLMTEDEDIELEEIDWTLDEDA